MFEVQIIMVDDRGFKTPHVVQKNWTKKQADLAIQLMPSVMNSLMMRSAHNQETPLQIPSPKQMASMACDIVQQMCDQFEERDWIIKVPDTIVTNAHGG